MVRSDQELNWKIQNITLCSCVFWWQYRLFGFCLISVIFRTITNSGFTGFCTKTV